MRFEPVQTSNHSPAGEIVDKMIHFVYDNINIHIGRAVSKASFPSEFSFKKRFDIKNHWSMLPE